MATITKVLHMENKGKYGLVYVQLNDGMEAVVIIGGSVETWLSHGLIHAFVKKKKDES